MLTHGRKRISLVLVLLLLCTTVLVATPQNAMAVTDEPQKVREVIELKEENAKVFLLDNGQIQYDIYPIDIHYRDKDGKLKDIDNSIKEASGKGDYIFSNTANSWYAFFKDSINKENSVRIEKDRYAIEFGLLNSKGSIIEKSNALTNLKCEFEKTIAEDNRAVVYKNAFNNVDIAYTVLTSGLKEDIILRDKTAQTTFEFTLKLYNLKLITNDERTTFLDEDGNEVFSMQAMYMEDANGKCSNAVDCRIEKNKDNYKITVSADKDFLNAADTVFPIKIDPTFNTSGSSYTSDSYVSSANPSTNYQTNDYLRTGKDTPYGVRQTFIRFKLPSGYKVGDGGSDGVNDGITAAKLKLKLYSKGSGTNNIRAYAVDNYWTSGTITWNNSRSLNTMTMSTVATISDNWYTMDVKSPIRATYRQDSGRANYGFVIKDNVEDDTNIWGTFYSSDSSSTSYLPILSITYTNITPYQYHSGGWASGLSDDLDIYVDSYANSYFGSKINAVWNLWNGINANLNIDSKSTSGNPDDYEIDIKAVTTLQSGVLGSTTYYNSQGTQIPNSQTRYSAIIELNRNSGQLSALHEDLQKETILHELGHTVGLAHVNAGNNDSSVCIMQQLEFYCYPSPTSHDRQTLDAKY
jgi:hypothetical protein